MYIETPGRSGVLYDPAGSFVPPEEPIRPSTAYFEEFDDADYFNAYLRYETRGNREVVVTTVFTTTEQEEQILQRTGGLDAGDPRGPVCAAYCSSAVAGVGPFDERGFFFPGGLRGSAERAAARVGGYQVRYFSTVDGQVQGELIRRWPTLQERQQSGPGCSGGSPGGSGSVSSGCGYNIWR